MRSAVLLFCVLALSGCAEKAGKTEPLPTTSGLNTIYGPLTAKSIDLGRLSTLFQQFETICIANAPQFGFALRRAKSLGYTPFLLPGFVQKKNDGLNALILHGKKKSDQLCQIVDSTVFGEDEDQKLRKFLAAKYSDFDPNRQKPTKTGTSYVIDVNGATYSFYAASKSEKGRAKKQSTALGMSRIN